jgi:probable addiction module antidote protein
MKTKRPSAKRKPKKPALSAFDAAEFLDNEEMIAEYLNAAMKETDPNVFLGALSDVARAKGIARIAEKSGLGRESLYKALKPGASPRFETIRKVIDALGVETKFAA